MVHSQPGHIVHDCLEKTHHKNELVEWYLSSSLSSEKKKKFPGLLVLKTKEAIEIKLR
jgi:hypothetical protein